MSAPSTPRKPRSTASSRVGTKSSASSVSPTVAEAMEAVKKQQARSIWKQLEDLTLRVRDHTPEYADFERVAHERDEALQQADELKKQLAKKTRDLRYTREHKKRDLMEFLELRDGYKKEIAELNEHLQSEKDEFLERYKSDRGGLESELDGHRAQVNTLSKELGNTRDYMRLLRTKLDVTTKELAYWEKNTSHLQPLDTDVLEKRVADLFEICFNSVRHHFEELPVEVFEKQDAWESGVQGLKLGFGFCPSNTTPAKFVRVAAAMHILWRDLLREIFQPCYTPDSAEQSKALQNVLDRYPQTDQKKRDLVHALLLSGRSREESLTVIRSWGDRAKQTVVRELCFMCRNSNDDTDGVAALDASLEAICQQASELWVDTLYSAHEVQMVTNDHDARFFAGEWAFGFWEELGQPAQPAREGLVGFPGVWLPHASKEIHPGLAFWRGQREVLLADSEWVSFVTARLARAPVSGSAGGASASVSGPAAMQGQGQVGGRHAAGRRPSISIRNTVAAPLSSPKERWSEHQSADSVDVRADVRDLASKIERLEDQLAVAVG